uniref:Casein kinase I n=1 Tax=Aureoumbra lagunensis TaxID=44058 RepID=A0A7S3JYC0_9STRA
MSSLEGSVLDGKWRVGHLLGVGACAQVYAASACDDEKSNDVFVIKASKLSRNKEQKRLADTLFQEHLVYDQICNRYSRYFAHKYKYGEEKGWRYLVMERLGHQISECEKYSVAQICSIGYDMVCALEILHSNGYVYADMKPENIMIGGINASSLYEARLIDFGLATRFRAAMTGLQREGSAFHVGTARFRGVESHANRLQPSRQNDCEALGHVLLSLANNGVLPWDRVETDEIKLIAKKQQLLQPQNTVAACSAIPDALHEPLTHFLTICRNTSHQETPDYTALKQCFDLRHTLHLPTDKKKRKRRLVDQPSFHYPKAQPDTLPKTSRYIKEQDSYETKAMSNVRTRSKNSQIESTRANEQTSRRASSRTTTTTTKPLPASVGVLKPTSRENLLALARAPNQGVKRSRTRR